MKESESNEEYKKKLKADFKNTFGKLADFNKEEIDEAIDYISSVYNELIKNMFIKF